ncbi:DUF2750 domain-containing protein [Nakamurella flavida]|uniref:DUF2750 domain-containing protein n=1 Tax=Nakamurella flavida TaxID=363630 RepID=A0A938YJ35_9ACTN|nr:DUF2750 domain-containing protein [Nakamurella flavida]MDP9777208.1 hypothetical protein [Nakamurella flavida]
MFTIQDDDGFPAPENSDGRRAMPFWSTRSRAERVCRVVPAYRLFRVVEITVGEWRERWLPGLDRDQLLVGVNWSGRRATGYDATAAQVEDRLRSRRIEV